MTGGELALAFISGGVGFGIADFVDRYMATYNPATGTPTATQFSGGTNGTLANTLNIAAPPGLMRIGIGVGITAVPGILAYLVKNPMGRAALQGMMLGAGIKLFSTLWNAYVMGNLLKPAASDATTMKASLGARVYPAEVVAAQNIAASPPAYSAPQGLNAPPQQQLPGRQAQPQGQRYAPQRQAVPYRQGVGDPGPFAMGAAVQPCPPGQMQDSLTGACGSPCWDGSAPANGQCPPQTNVPSGQTPPGYPPSGGGGGMPTGGYGGHPGGCQCGDCCGVGVNGKLNDLPGYLGYLSHEEG